VAVVQRGSHGGLRVDEALGSLAGCAPLCLKPGSRHSLVCHVERPPARAGRSSCSCKFKLKWVTLEAMGLAADDPDSVVYMPDPPSDVFVTASSLCFLPHPNAHMAHRRVKQVGHDCNQWAMHSFRIATATLQCSSCNPRNKVKVCVR
jgi:hypothetical protein